MRLLEALKNAIAENKVEYWEKRQQKPNLSRAEFDTAIKSGSLSCIKTSPRKSGDGVHGLDGEDCIYSAKITISRFNKTSEFYLKFFFWEKGESRIDQGVEVQSFRVWEE